MVWLSILIAALAGFAVVMVIDTALTYVRGLQIEKRLKSQADGAKQAHARGITGNLIFLAEKIGALVERRMQKKPIRQLESVVCKIRLSAGILGAPYSDIAPYTYVGIQIEAALGSMILMALLLDIYNPLLLLLAGGLGFYVPMAMLQEKVKIKYRALFRQIPDLLDLLGLMIEAGLDFNAALTKVMETEKGPLMEEFARAQQEIKLGKPRNDAFTDMAERNKYQPLTSVVNSLVLAFNTGGSIVPTLKTMSEQYRTERMQMAEKQANEAPLKLMMPLILFIFPTIFIILFGPIVLMFMSGGVM